MRAIETVARALALAVYREKHTKHYFDSDTGHRDRWIAKHWHEQEHRAADLLRALKGQPPHITDAGCNTSFADSLSPALDAMLEAMARS